MYHTKASNATQVTTHGLQAPAIARKPRMARARSRSMITPQPGVKSGKTTNSQSLPELDQVQQTLHGQIRQSTVAQLANAL